MRTLSVCELEMVVGGYDQHPVEYQDLGGNEYNIVAADNMSASMVASIDNAVATMNEADLNTFANQTAQDFYFPVGPFRLTPIINPFAGPNSIAIGGKAKVFC